MKIFFPFLNSAYLHSQLNKLVLLFLIIISLIFNNEAISQLCSAPPISPSTHVSVDPPTFQWYVAIAGSCGPVYLGAATECPINWQFPPPPFGSFPLTDTCFLMSNGLWNSTFSLNTQYCWGTHVVGGGLTWQTGGFPIVRLAAALPPVSLIFPANADTQISITPRINWIRIDSATSYTLRIYSDACCIAAVFDSTSASDVITVPMGRLTGNSRYYYRVKSYKSGGEGPFSDPFYFTTWTGQLPNLISPLNNSAGVQLTPLLDWDDVLNTLEYRVQVSTDINFNSIIVDNNGLTLSQYNIPAGRLTYNTVYYWRASLRTTAGWGPFSNSWNFRTYSMPDPVVLAYPGNNAIELPTSLTFRWYRAGETLSKSAPVSGLKGKLNRNDAINKYWFELTTDTVTLAGLITDNNITDTSKFISGLALAKDYYWRVKANNDLGWGPFSNWWKFTTVIGPPQAPVRISPQNNSFQQFLNLPFIWNKPAEITAKPINSYNNDLFNNRSIQQSSDAISAYWFELTEDTVSFSGIIRDSNFTDTVKFLNLSVNSKAYFWRVKAKNEAGWGVFSSWWKFITIPAQYGWSLAAANIDTYLTGISFVDQWNGWISRDPGGGSGVILRTTNGGSNWTNISEEFVMFPHSICFTSLNSGFVAAGGSGAFNFPIWSTGNGGLNWFSTLYINYHASNFRSIAQTPEGMWAVGTMTTQGNLQTYPAIMAGSTEHLLTHNIGLNRVRGGKNNAWIVGGQGLIYRSLTQLYVGEDVNLTGVSFNDNNTGYVVGGSKIFKSTNNGGNWFRIYPLTDQTTYNDVYFATKDTGWVACSLSGEGVIIGTTNGGASWGLQYKGQYIGSEFTFAENKYGWLLCGNSVLRTTNFSGPQILPPVLLLPADGAIAQSLTPQLDWQDALNALKYRVQISSDSLFTGLLIDDSSNTVSSYTVQPGVLQNYTQYYWRVASKNATVWSNFSPRFKFRTYGIPAVVILNSPPNNAAGQLTSITFKWFRANQTLSLLMFINKDQFVNTFSDSKKESDAINSYWFELTTDTNTSSYFLRDTTLSDTSRNVNNLINSTVYFWRVKAKNEIGWGEFSNWWKFTTITAAPSTPVLISPANGSTGQNLSLSLVWNKLPSAESYRLQVAIDSLFTGIIVNDSNITDSTRIISGLNPLTYYWWRVNAKNIGGTSGYSSAFKFKTIGAPTQPILYYPANNAANQLTNLTCIWGRSTDMLAPWLKEMKKITDENDFISSYWFDMVTDTVNLSNLSRDTTLTDTSKAINGLNYQTSYFWRVRAKNQIGWGNFSLWFKFITMPPPPALVNLTVILGGLFNTGLNQLNRKDTITVYLLDSVTCLKIDSSRGVLDSVNFTMPLTFSYAATGSYYLIVSHRNHLSIATRFTQSIVRGSSVSYNFTTDSIMAFGFNMIKVSNSPERWGMIPGDANKDGYIDAIDQFTWGMQNGLDGYLTADFNGDGFVDGIDQSIWIIFNGLSSYLPCGFTFSPGTQILIKNIPDIDVKKSKNIVPETKSQDTRIKNDKRPDSKKN